MSWYDIQASGTCVDYAEWNTMVSSICHKGGEWSKFNTFYSGTTQALKIMHPTNETRIYGGPATGDDLYIYPNNVDSDSYIQLLGNGSVSFGIGDLFRLYYGGTAGFYLGHTPNVSYIQGGAVSGDDLRLYSNLLDTYPYINLAGSGNIEYRAKDEHIFYSGASEVLRIGKTPTIGEFWFSTSTTNVNYGQLYVCTGNTYRWKKVSLT